MPNCGSALVRVREIAWCRGIVGVPIVWPLIPYFGERSMQPDTANGRRLQILLLTDVFPPGSGGSGWSTYYLGKALRDRGHGVYIIRPRYNERVARVERRIVEYRGLVVEELHIPA